MIRIRGDGLVGAPIVARVPDSMPATCGTSGREVRALEPTALLIDIEPFVADWGTDESALLRGLRGQLDDARRSRACAKSFSSPTLVADRAAACRAPRYLPPTSCTRGNRSWTSRGSRRSAHRSSLSATRC